jgi:hypothetical protein
MAKMVGVVGTSVKLGLVFEFLQLGVEVEELRAGHVLGLFVQDSGESGDVHSVDVAFGDLFENELAEGFFHYFEECLFGLFKVGWPGLYKDLCY